MSSARFEALRRRHEADREAAVAQYVEQLAWPADRLRAERERRMRLLLATAQARSSWHRDRLGAFEVDRFTEDELSSLPTMTKDDLMANFDAIVTDPRLTRDIVEARVERPPDDLYLFDRYLVIASGGSSGRRGVFVYDWDAFVTFSCQVRRWQIRNGQAAPAPWANLWASRGAHVSWVAFTVFPPPIEMIRIAPTLPLPEIVDRLHAVRPRTLSGYASTLALLAGEARAGRLAIRPEQVMTCGEPLLPEVREEIERVWPVRVFNYYGMSEGPYAVPCRHGDAMHLPDDLYYIEPVDESGRAVEPGTPAAKLLVTTLYNPTQPLIRYEVTDRVVVVPDPCPCGAQSRRIEQVLGRADDVFTYPDGARVHPLAIRAPLGRHRHVVEYQVLQTARGIQVRLCADGPVDRAALAATLAAGLRDSGVRDPEVTLEEVPELPRQVSGKMKRFVPRSGV